ncbi:MAG: LamB/YcsF family protein [Desulfomonile tiedjei]|nr:LamB/YcsF family protein [Desulfomonile tiedjei]
MQEIDLNCDMGESFGAYKLGLDEEVIKYISSANIACGWHAGDPMVMDRTVRLAASHGVGIGAHPGYPDLMGFGRRQMDCTGTEIRNYVIYQIGALKAFCVANGVRMRHVKPHGGLYWAAAESQAAAEAVVEAVASVDPELMCLALAGPKGELMAAACRRAGLQIVREAFPDRAYTPEGMLTPRRLPGAVISDPEAVAARALMIAKEGQIEAAEGTRIRLEAQTICVHGDNPTAVDLVRGIRRLLESEGVAVRLMCMAAGPGKT